MKTFIFVLTMVVFISCSEENCVESNIAYSKVQFDLQWGFEDKSVYIIVDTTYHFSAILSSSVPLAGPQASFNVLLEKGDHSLRIFGSNLGNIIGSFSDTTNISICNSPKYFIGLRLYADSLKVVVQDSSFFYR